MGALYKMVGRTAGVLGVLLALFAVVVRMGGNYTFGGFQVGTLFLAAVCAVCIGCLGYLASIVEGGGR
ncbi:MAG: hypothetical protein U1E86_09240 [Burkholderiaceae bacterium]